MAEREIKTSIGTFINEQGNSEFGFKGDTVKVHDDHVERFDELNVDAGDPVEFERVGVEVYKPARASDAKSDDDDDDEEEPAKEPAKRAPAKKAT